MKKSLSVILTVLILIFCAVPGFADDTGFNGITPDNIIILSDGENADFSPLGGSGSHRTLSSSLPSFYDARNAGVITSVKSQGTSGACWAFSAVSVLESAAISQGYAQLEDADFSESHLIWFGQNGKSADPSDHNYGEGKNNADPYHYGGNWMVTASALSKWSGIAAEADYPFDLENYEDFVFTEADRYNTGSGLIIENAEYFTDSTDIKKWITEYGSVTAAFYYNDAFLTYKGGECSYYCNQNVTSNHAVTIIGWDDDYPAENFGSIRPETPGAWICKDSWGTYSKKDGFFCISYSDATLRDTVGFSVQPKEDYLNNYTYTAGAWNGLVECYGTVSLANVFRASGYEKLSAVSTVTSYPGETATISIYKGFSSSAKTPESGTCALSFSASFPNSGYHTVKLPEKVSLTPGMYYSVVIDYSCNASSYHFPVETDGIGIDYTYNTGETFLKLPCYNPGWYEAGIYGVKNAFIQAFTECDHSYIDNSVEPTCTESGFRSLTCSRCGKAVEEELPAAGHSMTEWHTETLHGRVTAERHCTGCGLTESQSYSKGNTLYFENFIEMIFERIISVIREAFAALKP